MWPFRRGSTRRKRSKSAERVRQHGESKSRKSRDKSKSSKSKRTPKLQQRKPKKQQSDDDGVTEFEEVDVARKPARTKVRRATLKWKEGVQEPKSAEPKTPPPPTGSLMLSVSNSSMMSTVSEKSTMATSMGEELPEPDTQSDASDVAEDEEEKMRKKEDKDGKTTISRRKKTMRMKGKSIRGKKTRKEVENHKQAIPPKSTLMDVQMQGELKSVALKPNVELSKSMSRETSLYCEFPLTTPSSSAITTKSLLAETNAPKSVFMKASFEAVKKSEMKTIKLKQEKELDSKSTAAESSALVGESPKPTIETSKEVISSSMVSKKSESPTKPPQTGSLSMEMLAITIPSEKSITTLSERKEDLSKETIELFGSSPGTLSEIPKPITETSKEVISSSTTFKESTTESPQISSVILPEIKTQSSKSPPETPQMGSSSMEIMAITIPSEKSINISSEKPLLKEDSSKEMVESLQLPSGTLKPTESVVVVDERSELATELRKEIINLPKVVPEEKIKSSTALLEKSGTESPQIPPLILPEEKTQSLESEAKLPQMTEDVAKQVTTKSEPKHGVVRLNTEQPETIVAKTASTEIQAAKEPSRIVEDLAKIEKVATAEQMKEEETTAEDLEESSKITEDKAPKITTTRTDTEATIKPKMDVIVAKMEAEKLKEASTIKARSEENSLDGTQTVTDKTKAVSPMAEQQGLKISVIDVHELHSRKTESSGEEERESENESDTASEDGSD